MTSCKSIGTRNSNSAPSHTPSRWSSHYVPKSIVATWTQGIFGFRNVARVNSTEMVCVKVLSFYFVFPCFFSQSFLNPLQFLGKLLLTLSTHAPQGYSSWSCCVPRLILTNRPRRRTDRLSTANDSIKMFFFVKQPLHKATDSRRSYQRSCQPFCLPSLAHECILITSCCSLNHVVFQLPALPLCLYVAIQRTHVS